MLHPTARRPIAALAALLLATAWAGRVAGEEGPAPEGEPPRVSAVELRLPPGEDRAAAAALLEVAPGDRLSQRALRTSVQRLYQTGRFRNVIVRAEPAPAPAGQGGEWVRIAVEALAQRRLGRLVVRSAGPAVLSDDALRTAARLAPGEPYDEADLEAAEGRLREALARKGYQRARVVATVRGETAVSVDLAVVAGEPTRVRSVRLEGEAGPAQDAVRGLHTRPGAVLDQDALAEDARALRAALYAAGHRRARVGAPAVSLAGDGAAVVFPVEAGPRVYLRIRGNAALPTATLMRQMGLEQDQPLDPTALEAAAERVRVLYRAHGYAAAAVEVEEEPLGGDLAVLLRVSEGLPYRLNAVRLEGLGGHPARVLRARLTSYLAEDPPRVESTDADALAAQLLAASLPSVRARPGLAPPLPPGDYYEEAAWDRAAERLAETARGEGWLEAVYLGSAVSLDRARRDAEVTLRFREGPRTRVVAVHFEGNQALPSAELLKLSRLAPGDPLAYALVEETRSALLRRYASRGHVFARVEAREQIDPATHLAILDYAVDEGPEVHVGRVQITGNRRTREDLVRRNVVLREGQVYDPEAAARSQSALLDTGVFRSVSLRMQDPDTPQETKDVLVDLAERPYATLTQAIGFSIADGPRVVLEYARPNLLGRALAFTLVGKVNYPTNILGLRPDLAERKPEDRIEGQLDAGLRTARFAGLPFPAEGRVNLIGEVVHRPAYNLRRVSGVTGVDAGVTSRTTFSLQYELEVDRIDRTGAAGPLTQVDLERLRFDEGTTTLNAVRASAALDLRDNSTHPEKGAFATAAAEYEHSLGDPGQGGFLGILPPSDIHTNLIKLSGLLSGYVPLGGHTVLALSARAGQVFPLDPDSRTIIPRRFFLGGASTLRGFGEEQLVEADVRDQLAEEARQCATSATGAGCTDAGKRIAQGQLPVSEGGEAFLLFKGELRLPVAERFELGLFLDAGNLWLDPKHVNPQDLRPCAGVGARFVTPIGPAALDLGFNLDRDARINEAVFAPHFTIGLF
ncbi:MAG TPA: POTRA domain-containing protein [Anaeromyxobacter sp.]|nr:POTRA domain-containing protein [Anaeromyxobacter sp.]